MDTARRYKCPAGNIVFYSMETRDWEYENEQGSFMRARSSWHDITTFEFTELNPKPKKLYAYYVSFTSDTELLPLIVFSERDSLRYQIRAPEYDIECPLNTNLINKESE